MPLPGWIKFGALGVAALGVSVGTYLATTYERWKLPSSSMWPTQTVGQHFFARRFSGGAPPRGAIVVFRYPEHPGQSFVKRVVGLPGDKIEVVEQDVRINGWTIPSCVVGKASYEENEDGSLNHKGELRVEWLNNTAYLVFHDAAGAWAGYAGPFIVKEGEYFVLGDNRANSHDSRMWNMGAGGGVPFANTQGVVNVPLEKLPPWLDAQLAPALAACLAKPPAKTSP